MGELNPPRWRDPLRAIQELKSHNIPCVLWGEDVLAHYGVPTIVFDIFILVADPAAAAHALRGAGWLEMPIDPGYKYVPEFTKGSIRLSKDPQLVLAKDIRGSAVVLLPCTTWHIFPSKLEQYTDPIPPLKDFVESYIDVWLDSEGMMFRQDLLVHTAYLLRHVDGAKPEQLQTSLTPGYHADYWRAYSGCFLNLEGEREQWQQRRQEQLKNNPST